MKRTKATIFALAAAVLFSGGAALPALQGAAAEEQPTQIVEIGKENTALFLPDGYEQYLPLVAPTDAAFSKHYIAVADGDTLYVYDKAAKRYASYKHSSEITKLQFSQDERLFFADRVSITINELSAESLNRLSAQQAAIPGDGLVTAHSLPGGTFYIANSTLYCVAVVSTATTVYSCPLTALGQENMVEVGVIDQNITPNLTYADGTLYCAVNEKVYFTNTTGKFAEQAFTLTSATNYGKITSVCFFDGYFYYTASGGFTENEKGEKVPTDGLYRSSSRIGSSSEAADRVAEGKLFNSLVVYGDSLYCVKGKSVLQTAFKEDGSAYFTGYELCDSSSSVNRLGDGVATARAKDLLVIADKSNLRLSVYDFTERTYSSIPVDYTPSLVATDGEKILSSDEHSVYEYTREGEFLSEKAVSQMTITGVACVYGTGYFVTENGGFGMVDGEETLPVFHGGGSVGGLAADVYGNLYVGFESDGTVVKYTESEFMNAESRGTTIDYKLPNGFSNLSSDFEGNLYCLSDGVLYRNGEKFATLNSEGCVFRKTEAPLRAYALGFEDNTVYFLYDNFILATNALRFPTLSTIPTEGIENTLYAVQGEPCFVNISKGAVGFKTDLGELKPQTKSGEGVSFPFESYFRSEESTKGILLSETSEYKLVALFGKDRKYTANLFKSEFCEEVDRAEFWKDGEGTLYLTSEVSTCFFPCMMNALRGDRLERATEVSLVGTVAAGDTSEYAYALIEYTVGKNVQMGYVPLSYLTKVTPKPENETFYVGYLKANGDGLILTSEDGEKVTLTERTRAELAETIEGYRARVVVDGKAYFADVTKDDVEIPVSDALRISLIVILCIVAVIIVGVYVVFYPRKKTRP